MGLTEEKKVSLRAILELVEIVVKNRKLSRPHHRDEVEKYLNFLLQGRDLFSPHERRNAGVSDELWDQRLMSFQSTFGLINKAEDSNAST
jgi:hypothetical protein